jgi:drug/metabolite transporter (DMT)-like permease
VLGLGVFALSWSSIFILMCDAPAAVIAFYRVVGAVVLLLPARLRHRGRRMSPRLHLAAAVSGTCLAFHWGTWIQSVQMTSVASAVFLVSTQPIWAALLGSLFLREHVGRKAVAGIGVAFGGMGMIATAGGPAGGSWAGNGLALVAAVLGAAYLLIGRRNRAAVDFVPYLFTVYTAAAIALGAVVLALRIPFYPYPLPTMFWIGMLAVVCSLFGHGSLNWAVRHMRAYVVNLAVLLEPILATLYAFLLFGQEPGVLVYPGAALVVAGLAVAVFDERRREFGSAALMPSS